MVKRMARLLAALAAAAILSVTVVSCGESGTPSSTAPAKVTYKCGSCNKTQALDAAAAAPS